MKINKELLSEVLNITVVDFSCHIGFICVDEKTIRHTMNIYELSHKCKEWAIKNKYPINILYDSQWWDKLEMPFSADLYNHRKTFSADTEIEAIFKACKWIFENKYAK